MKLKEVVCKGSFDLAETTRVVYSVSLTAEPARLAKIVAGYEWALSQFPDVALYVGDGPLLETTLRLSDNCGEPPERARAIAGKTLQALNDVGRPAEIFAASALPSNPTFVDALQRINAQISLAPMLRASVESDAEDYVNRVERRNELVVDKAHATELAKQYIAFEIAGYLTLARAGYLVDVYATGSSELPTLARFIHGELTGFPELAERKCLILGRKK